MANTWDDHVWFSPEDVLVIHDSEFNVVAYGVPDFTEVEDDGS